MESPSCSLRGRAIPDRKVLQSGVAFVSAAEKNSLCPEGGPWSLSCQSLSLCSPGCPPGTLCSPSLSLSATATEVFRRIWASSPAMPPRTIWTASGKHPQGEAAECRQGSDQS